MRACRCHELGCVRVTIWEGKSAKWLGRKALIRQSFVITAFVLTSELLVPTTFTSVKWGSMPRDEPTNSERREQSQRERRKASFNKMMLPLCRSNAMQSFLKSDFNRNYLIRRPRRWERSLRDWSLGLDWRDMYSTDYEYTLHSSIASRDA